MAFDAAQRIREGPRPRGPNLKMTLEAGKYLAIERARDGREVKIRALRLDDRTDLLAAVGGLSPQSVRRRFFGPKRGFSEEEISYFVDVDFVNHVALVAELQAEEQALIVGGARYVVLRPGVAEIAFAVVDQYQGQGIGAALMRHLVRLAREAGLHELIAEVLPENVAIMKMFAKSGLGFMTRHTDQVLHVSFRLS
jgi:RimJ/RimL family protein N-acetyltransferase